MVTKTNLTGIEYGTYVFMISRRFWVKYPVKKLQKGLKS